MKKNRRWIVGIVLSLTLILGLTSIPVFADLGGDKPDLYNNAGVDQQVDEIMPGELLVGFKEGTTRKELAKMARRQGAKLGGVNRSINVALFRVTEAPRANAVMENLKQAPDVAFVEPNGIARIPEPVVSDSPGKNMGGDAAADKIWTDPMASYQWHLIKILDIWTTVPSSAPTIAVLDTGVDYLHNDLAGKVIKGKDYYYMDNDPMDDHGHGTHVAGIAAATGGNGQYGVGVSPKSKILAVKVLGPTGSGSWWMVSKGVTYAANRPAWQKVKVINMSLGGSSSSSTLQSAVNYAYGKGIVVVASAGNSNTYSYQYPSAYSATLSVAAIEQEGCRTTFSNYNYGSYTAVDIAAPGYEIRSTYPGQQAKDLSGTSMSAPVVSGAAARVFAKYGNSKTPAWVMSRLKTKADSTTCGFPTAMKELNLHKALGGSATGFRGLAYDGVSGQPLKGATVRIYQGTSLKKTTTTNGSGMWAVRGLTGGVTYKVKVTKSGYVPLKKFYKAKAGKVWETVKHFLAPVRQADDITIILDWRNSQPYYTPPLSEPGGYELDAWLNPPGSGDDYIYYGNPGALGTSPWVQWLRDSYNDLVHAEAIIISKVQSGTYKFGANRHSTFGWGNMGQSGAVVRVYKGSALKKTVKINASACSGKSWWYAVKIVGSSITPQNACSNTRNF
jgi:thermitase